MYPSSKSQPCALVKLSCKLRANINVLEIKDPGNGARRLPVRDVGFGEVLSANILKLSRLASEVMIPASGIVFTDFSHLKRIWELEEFEYLPDTCVRKHFNGNTLLLGHIQQWVPGLRAAKLRPDLKVVSTLNQVALAITVILDALTLNADRRPNSNMFATKNGNIVPLDFEKWFQESQYPVYCAGTKKVQFDRAIVQATQRPRCLSGKADLRPVFQIAYNITSEMCRSFDQICNLSVKDLATHLLADPYFAYVTSEQQELSHTMCCNGYNDGPKRRRCHACRLYSKFSQVFQKPLDISCRTKFSGLSVIEILATIVLDRLIIVRSTLATLVHTQEPSTR